MTHLHFLKHCLVHFHARPRAPTELEVVPARTTPHRLEAARHNTVRLDRFAPERGRVSIRRGGVVCEASEVIQVVIQLGADGPGLHVGGDLVSVWVWGQGAPVGDVEVCAVDAEAADVVDEEEFVAGGLRGGGVEGDDVLGEVEG